MLANGRFVGLVNIRGPFCKIAVATATESREKRKLEMIVRVNEPWQQQVSVEVKAAACPRRSRCPIAIDRVDVSVRDSDIGVHAFVRAKRHTRTAQRPEHPGTIGLLAAPT